MYSQSRKFLHLSPLKPNILINWRFLNGTGAANVFKFSMLSCLLLNYFVLWNELMKAELEPWKFWKANILSFSLSSQRNSPLWKVNISFPNLFCLCFRVSLSAKPFLWKWLWCAWKWNGMHNSFSYERFHT